MSTRTKGQLDDASLSGALDGMAGANMRIAVVDDDVFVCKALALLLRANEFEAETYGSAQSFIDSLDMRRPECLILDLHMPDCGGLDLKNYLKRKGIDIPTVMITAYRDPDLEQLVSLAGVVAFLIKPLTEDALIGSIKRATEGR